MITNEQLADCAQIIDTMMIDMVNKHSVTFSELSATVLARLTQLAESTKNEDILCGIANAMIQQIEANAMAVPAGSVMH